MKIDRLHYVGKPGSNIGGHGSRVEIDCLDIIEDARTKEFNQPDDHTVYVVASNGVAHLFMYEDAAMAAADFEEFRNDRGIARIELTQNGVRQEVQL